MERTFTAADIENAINLDPLENEIAPLEVFEAESILRSIANFAGNDNFATISLGILYGYKVGWHKAQILNRIGGTHGQEHTAKTN